MVILVYSAQFWFTVYLMVSAMRHCNSSGCNEDLLGLGG